MTSYFCKKNILSERKSTQINIDLIIMTLSTTLAILCGGASVFYVIYMFWWSEIIKQVVGRLTTKSTIEKNTKNEILMSSGFWFLMFIYLVFIIVLFGFIADFGNKNLVYQNVRLLLFQNWFFNGYLIFTILETWYLYRSGKKSRPLFTSFSPNMVVMHLSVIFGGAMLMFMTILKPSLFSEYPTMRSILMIAPFLILRYIVLKYFNKNE